MENVLAAVSEPATIISGIGASLAFWCIKKLIGIDRKMTRIETALGGCPLLKTLPPLHDD